MATYEIYEGNFEQFERKLNKIIKKSMKYPECSIEYKVLGDVYKTFKDDNGYTHTYKFIKVDVCGTVINNGWRFLATLEHVKEGQNVIRKADEAIEVPEYFSHVKCKCDHCQTNRQRKDTYIVYNEETNEFKQVGKTCLKEYTNGLSAESIACFESFIHEAEKAEYGFNHNFSSNSYVSLEKILRYAYPIVKQYGYVPTKNMDGCDNPKATKWYTLYMYDYFEYKHSNETSKKIINDGYDKDAVDEDFIHGAIDWIRNTDENNEYIRNLKAVCSREYISLDRDLGIVVSIIPTYSRELKHQEYIKATKEEARASEYVGEINQKVSFKANTAMCVTSYETRFGTTYIYKFTDTANNVFIWKTSKSINTDAEMVITGTVKAHNEYKGTKQTELTRCRV